MYVVLTTGSPQDQHSTTLDPKLVNPVPYQGDFHLQSGSPAIAAGKNLYSYCTNPNAPMLANLCFDWDGNPRSATGNWDLGAYNYVP